MMVCGTLEVLQWPPLESIMTLAFVSTALCTINIVLALVCIRQILAHKSFIGYKRRRLGTCLYIIVLAAVASAAAIQLDMGVLSIVKSFRLGQKYPTFPIYSPLLPLAIWGADGILV